MSKNLKPQTPSLNKLSQNMAIKLTDKQREKIEEGGWVRGEMVIQVQGNDPVHVKKGLNEHIDKIRKEEGLELFGIEAHDTKEFKQGIYACDADIGFLAKDFNVLTRLALLYSPSSIEIFEPKELKIPLGDAQNILVDISNIVTSLAHAVFVQEGQLRKYRSENPQDIKKQA